MTDVQKSIIDRQVALEEESLVLGAERYMRDRERSQEAETSPGLKIVKQSLKPMAEAVEAFVQAAKQGGAGRRHASVKWLEPFNPDALAYLTAIHVINAVTGDPKRIQAIAEGIAIAIEDDINYSKFREQQPGLYKHLMKVLKKSTSARHRKGVMSAAMSRTELDTFTFPGNDRVNVGAKLIELFVESTGLAVIYNDSSHGRSRERVLLRGAESLMEWLDRAHEAAAQFHPQRMPMLAPPKPWTNHRDGGYLTNAGGRVRMVRTRNRAYLAELDNADMPDVYQALNAIQATPWRINGAVLDVMQEAWDAGGRIGGLPDREQEPLPAKPRGLVENPDLYKEEHAEEFKRWKRSRAEVYERNGRAMSKRVASGEKMSLARRFANESSIYFPHSLDFRGRVYPVPSLLTPQGDDQAKALLHFAEGVPLGEHGPYWLAVHLANTFGVDKVSFEERVAWVHQNEEAILDSALSPLDGSRFWEGADSPWCALAACFEWAGYKLMGKGYVSRIPIALDGSCNGLQNFSAMLRDSVGGAATNLVPQEKPADIYTEVMKVAEKRVKKEAEAGNTSAIYWDGLLSRSVVKRPVMTLPYGVTQPGMRDQILAAMKKDGMGDSWEAATYLASVLWDCIGLVVVAAREAMDWLKAAAKVAAKGDMPVSWTTPAGFPVLQEYRKNVGKRVCIHISVREVKLTASIDGFELDARRQALGISPNFVHSCDASHMMLTTCLAQENGVAHFAMIHDSYGTHAGNTDVLAAALRHAFVEQYRGSVLGDFKRELEGQLPPDIAAELPDLPATGDLDLSLVLDAEYFFA